MKLAEALALRADINKRIAEVTSRMAASALVQEGLSAPEDPDALLEQVEAMTDRLQGLIGNINRTNLAVALPDGRSLTAAIAERDVLLVRISSHRKLADAATVKQAYQTRSEIRYVAQVNVAELRKKIDALSKRYREVDVMIQSANWSMDLLES